MSQRKENNSKKGPLGFLEVAEGGENKNGWMGNLFSYLFVEVKNGKRARVSIDCFWTGYYRCFPVTFVSCLYPGGVFHGKVRSRTFLHVLSCVSSLLVNGHGGGMFARFGRTVAIWTVT